MCGQKAVEEFEVETGELTIQALCLCCTPGSLPVCLGRKFFHPDWNESGWGVLNGGGHQHLVLQHHLVPLLSRHDSNVQGTGFMVMSDDVEELSIIVRRKARVC